MHIRYSMCVSHDLYDHGKLLNQLTVMRPLNPYCLYPKIYHCDKNTHIVYVKKNPYSSSSTINQKVLPSEGGCVTLKPSGKSAVFEHLTFYTSAVKGWCTF